MEFLTKLTIKSRLAVGFGMVLLLMVLLTVIGVLDVNSIDRKLTQITDVNSVKQRYAINYRGSVHDRAIAIRDIAIARNRAEVAEFEREINQLADFYRESESKMQQMMASNIEFSSKERQILADINAIQSKTLPIVSAIISAKKAGDNVNEQVLQQARPAFIAWLKAINQFIDHQEQQNQTVTPEAREIAGNFQNVMFALVVVAIVISLLVGFMIERSLHYSLGAEPFEAQQALNGIADGDLLTAMKTEHENSMLTTMCKMRNKLAATVSNIIKAASELELQIGEVAASSKQVVQSAQGQAQLTEQTAQQLESMRTSIDQVSGIATRTEENSGLTVQYAKQGREVIQQSAAQMELISTTVNNTVEQIRKLEEHTKQIGGIASVISGISEQTNLLALNAAIEAARAGESGRGFAVVADEVRQLAQRTGEATAQIESMIGEVQSETEASVAAMETTQPQVESGKAKTLEATELLQDIEQQADDSLNRVKELVTAANDQVLSIGEVASAMEQISDMSNDTMGSLRNNDAATQTLSQVATKLKQDVSFFKV